MKIVLVLLLVLVPHTQHEIARGIFPAPAGAAGTQLFVVELNGHEENE